MLQNIGNFVMLSVTISIHIQTLSSLSYLPLNTFSQQRIFVSFQQIHGDTVQNQLVVQCVEIPLYLTLYSPAIDWILQCIAYHAPDVSERDNAHY